MKVRHPTAWAVAALSLVAMNPVARAQDPTKTVVVDCAAGDTIAKALTLGDERKPMLVQISGTCSEHVMIDRSDVTLAANAPGATVSGPDGAIDVIRVTGSRVTIDGITVTGGRNGILADGAPGLTVHNAVVQGTGRNGITYARGASGLVDASVAVNNARDGVAIDAASGTVINSQVNQNGRVGVGVFTNGAARIGVDNGNNAGGNVISGNASNGIHIVFGSSALVGMNQITNNGASPTGAVGRVGIGIFNASADIIGGNTISGNAGTGVSVRASAVTFGDGNFGFTTVNTITANGNAASPGGVFGFLGTSMLIRDLVVSGNMGFGLILSLRSEAQISSSTIQNNLPAGGNTGDGIRLVFGSGLFLAAPNSTVTGNTGWGLNCTDGESSVINTGFLILGGNALGGVAPSCTGF